ncbi:MAG TPA: hypothetical protein VLC93_04940 [Myxococcota bacterium]|nr:hypothetical protein [Myxococcota bacterium]
MAETDEDGDPGDEGDGDTHVDIGDFDGDAAPTDEACVAPALRVLLVFNDTAVDPEISPREDVLSLLEILRTQSQTRVALIAGSAAVRTSAWFDAARDEAWAGADLDALLGPAELDTQFDLQASMNAAHATLESALAAEVLACATAPYVLVLLGRYAPGPVCTADEVDLDAGFPDMIDRLCEDIDYRACVLAAGVCEDGALCDDARGVGCLDGDACEEPTCGSDPANGGAFVCTAADGNTACFSSIYYDDLFGGLTSLELLENGDYNQRGQLEQRARNIVELFIMKGSVSLDAVAVMSSPQPLPATIYESIAIILDGTFAAHERGEVVDWNALGFSTSGFARPTP